VAGKRKGGPVPLIDAEKVKSIVRDLGAGVPRKFAAERVGISESCLYKWLAKGRKGGKKNVVYVQLVQDVKKAEAEALAASVARIRKAGQGGAVIERTTTTTTSAKGVTTTKTVEKLQAPAWQADAWFLERRHPKEFARKDHTTTTLKGGRQLGAKAAPLVIIRGPRTVTPPKELPESLTAEASDASD
jgi:transposase